MGLAWDVLIEYTLPLNLPKDFCSFWYCLQLYVVRILPGVVFYHAIYSSSDGSTIVFFAISEIEGLHLSGENFWHVDSLRRSYDEY